MDHGRLQIQSVTLTNGKYVVAFSYTLVDSHQGHSENGDPNAPDFASTWHGGELLDQAMPAFMVSATDKQGVTSQTSTKVTVKIHDDAPIMTLTPKEVPNGEGYIVLGENEVNFVTTGVIERAYGADDAQNKDAGGESLKISWDSMFSLNSGDTAEQRFGEKPVTFDADGKASVQTELGFISFTRDAATGKIAYTYKAIGGQKGNTETITFTVTDGDGDTASSSMQVEMLFPVPAGIGIVDEAGLTGLGSHHFGYGGATYSFKLVLPEGDVTDFKWDLQSIEALNIKADIEGDTIGPDWGDGNYEQVTFSVDPTTKVITGKVGDVTVLTITPPENIKTGDFRVELFKPIEHAEGTDNAYLKLPFSATMQPDATNPTITNDFNNSVVIQIVDDIPDARAGAVTTIAEEAQSKPENIYLVIDDSRSMDASEVQLELNAMKAMVQKYIDLGIDARFTYIEFSNSATLKHDGKTPQEMRDILNGTAPAAGDGGTNYNAALNLTMRELEKDFADPNCAYSKNTVYFISDGQPSDGQLSAGEGGYVSNRWRSFVETNDIKVVAVGAGDGANNNAATTALGNVTANIPSNEVVQVAEFGDLLDKLTGLVSGGTAEGNLLGDDIDVADARSADLTIVDAVYVEGRGWIEIPADEDGRTIGLESGVKLTVWQNGDYKVMAGENLSQDVNIDVQYRLKDADGDTSESRLSIVVKDSAPQAFDNLATADTSGRTMPGTTIETFENLDHCTTTPGSVVLADGTVVISANGQNLLSSELFPAVPPNLNNHGNLKDGGAVTVRIEQVDADGNITFEYSLQNGSFRFGIDYFDRDAAIYVLKDENDNVKHSGVIKQAGPEKTCTGTATIPVEVGGPYYLTIAVVDAGLRNSEEGKLTIERGGLVFTPTAAATVTHSGNVITDSGPDGTTDVLADRAKLLSFTYEEKVYEFTQNVPTTVWVTSDDGLFAMNNLGEYAYSGGARNADIEYTLRDQDNDTDSAMLFIRDDAHVFTDDNNHAGQDRGDCVYKGTDGDDIIFAGTGNDAIYGGTGNDELDGGAGDDRLFGGRGNDNLYGGLGNDTLDGGAGDDVLYGGPGSDLLYGGDGDDILFGGIGNDIMYGGSGQDIFAWASGDLENGGTDRIMDFAIGEDKLYFEDLFGPQESMNDLLAKLQDREIDIEAQDGGNTLVVTTAGQDVELYLEGGIGDVRAQLINNDDVGTDKAALLLQMLALTTG